MNTVLCPNCKHPVEISEAIKHQVEEQILTTERGKFKAELAKARLEAEEKATDRIKEELGFKLKDSQNEIEEERKRNKELSERLLEMTKAMRELSKKDDERELEMQKRLAEEEEKIRRNAQKKAEDEQHGKIAEKDKQLQDALKEIDEMKRKLQQGSQQTQGEAFELEFEAVLRGAFPNDKILPVGKGVKGADIIQEVWDSKGNFNGKILWELKNTKNWQESWVEKLKGDKRGVKAEEAVLISEILPMDMKTAGFRNGIWVTSRQFVLTLAAILRAKLIEIHYVKQSVQAKDGKMELMYAYLSGTEFKHRVEAIIEAFTNMQLEIEKEKRYFSSKWARDEKNIRLVIDNTYGMHGDLKAIIGRVLPQIKGLDLSEYDSNDTQLVLADKNSDS